MHVCVPHDYSFYRGQKKALDALDLECRHFLAAMWMLGIKSVPLLLGFDQHFSFPAAPTTIFWVLLEYCTTSGSYFQKPLYLPVSNGTSLSQVLSCDSSGLYGTLERTFHCWVGCPWRHFALERTSQKGVSEPAPGSPSPSHP